MPEEDYWLPVRRGWDANVSLMLNATPKVQRSKFVIKRRWNVFADSDVAIAILGMRGTGKSTLLKALRRRLRLGDYEPRGESPEAEPDRFVAQTDHGKKRVQTVVVPGQKDSVQGRRTLRRHFENGHSPSGVVHVVSWGYSTIWDANAEGLALAPTSTVGEQSNPALDIKRVREYNLEGELDDFRQTRALLQASWKTTAKPLWLVIAVGKADLFRDEASARQVRDYYVPAADPAEDGAFARELRGLVNHLGQTRFADEASSLTADQTLNLIAKRIAVVPVVSFLEDYSAGGATVKSNGDLNLVSVLMANFSNTIGEFCGGKQA